MSLIPIYQSRGRIPLEESDTNPITTQYNQKSLKIFNIRGRGFLMGGNLRTKIAITGIKIPIPAEQLEVFCYEIKLIRL